MEWDCFATAYTCVYESVYFCLSVAVRLFCEFLVDFSQYLYGIGEPLRFVSTDDKNYCWRVRQHKFPQPLEFCVLHTYANTHAQSEQTHTQPSLSPSLCVSVCGSICVSVCVSFYMSGGLPRQEGAPPTSLKHTSICLFVFWRVRLADISFAIPTATHTRECACICGVCESECMNKCVRVCVCICVHVCVREWEREKEKEREPKRERLWDWESVRACVRARARAWRG